MIKLINNNMMKPYFISVHHIDSLNNKQQSIQIIYFSRCILYNVEVILSRNMTSSHEW